jgi:hypothetical protein
MRTFVRARRATVLILFLSVSIVVPALAQVEPLVTPADSGSSLPFLSTAPDGRVFLSWVEPTGPKRHALKFSVLTGAAWSEPRTIAEGEGWFVNWADFPSIVPMPDGSLAAHWLERSGPDTYAYGVRISRSADVGTTWSPAVIPHRDSTQTEHGFVSMFPAPGPGAADGAGPSGSTGAVWLDGREMAGQEEGAEGHAGGHGGDGVGSGSMTLRYASIDAAGTTSEEALLDERVCECCQTSAAMTEEGPVVVYRDRFDGEIRDISIVRRSGGMWGRPSRLSYDEWKIDGCPVNGPAVDARGREVAVAWFTAAGDTPRVKLAFSRDAGATFSSPVVIDDGSPSGRVDVALLPGGDAVVSWLERSGGAAEVRVKRVTPDGKPGPPIVVAPTGTARSSGFPRIAYSGGRLVFAWTADRVRTAILPIQP